MTRINQIPPVGDEVRARIQTALDEIERRNDVRVLLAVESGSRAWGFHSPDSDYDVRFIYAHPLDWYLSITPGRDVIERPISNDLDINGWDIRKTLTLLLKYNPSLLEWLSSPIIYRDDKVLRAGLNEIAEEIDTPVSSIRHYMGLARSQYGHHIEGRKVVRLKRYGYVVRPAVAIRWLRKNPGKQVPMSLHDMLSGAQLRPATERAIDRFLTAKSHADEVGEGPPIRELNDLVTEELEIAKSYVTQPPPISAEARRKADALLRAIIKAEG